MSAICSICGSDMTHQDEEGTAFCLVCENAGLHVLIQYLRLEIAQLEVEQEILLKLIPHNDVWDEVIIEDDVKFWTECGWHGTDPKPFGNWGHGLHPEPCRKCLAEATLKEETIG